MSNEFYTVSQLGEGIYISGIMPFSNSEINKYNIDAILSITYPDMYVTKHVYDHKLDHEIITIDDLPNVNIARYFDHTNNLISNWRKEGKNVLVHCTAGMSRSATILAAYLISVNPSCSLDTILSYMRSKRKIINPNVGFFYQLQRYARDTAQRYAKTQSKHGCQL